MRKKVLSIILGMAMLSGVLAGCGSNGGDTVQNNTAAESEASAATVDPDTENTETESEETQYPITISHAYGETVIESKPERIVTLGWGNQDKEVGSCIMGALNKPALTELLGIEEPLKLACMVAFGYPTHAARVVPMTPETGVKYYLDDNRDYCVPKRSRDEIARWL